MKPTLSILATIALIFLIQRCEFSASASTSEFISLAFQSCRWRHQSARSPPAQTAADSADAPAETASTDCWKAYSGFPFGCPHRGHAWIWLGHFGRPVNLQRVVIDGSTDDGVNEFSVGVAGVSPGGTTIDCRLEQSAGRMSIFGCGGSGGLPTVARTLVVRLRPKLMRRRSLCRLRLCGIRAFDSDSRHQLSFTACRQSPTLPGATAPSCQPSQPSPQTPPAESPAWSGNFGIAGARVGLVTLDACPTTTMPQPKKTVGHVDNDDVTCQELEVTAGASRCREIISSSTKAETLTKSFNCGGVLADGVTVARQPAPTMRPPPTDDFQLCKVMAYGLETSSSHLLGSSMYRG